MNMEERFRVVRSGFQPIHALRPKRWMRRAEGFSTYLQESRVWREARRRDEEARFFASLMPSGHTNHITRIPDLEVSTWPT